MHRGMKYTYIKSYFYKPVTRKNPKGLDLAEVSQHFRKKRIITDYQKLEPRVRTRARLRFFLLDVILMQYLEYNIIVISNGLFKEYLKKRRLPIKSFCF